MTLPTLIYHAFQDEAHRIGRDPHEYIERVLTEHAITMELIDTGSAERLRLGWSLGDRAIETARELCRKGAFASDIIRETFQRCGDGPTWRGDYERYIGGDIYRHGNPLKSINKEIGHRIRAGIGGTVLRHPNGKPVKEKVSGAIIQSFTLMERFDPEAVGAHVAPRGR